VHFWSWWFSLFQRRALLFFSDQQTKALWWSCEWMQKDFEYAAKMIRNVCCLSVCLIIFNWLFALVMKQISFILSHSKLSHCQTRLILGTLVMWLRSSINKRTTLHEAARIFDSMCHFKRYLTTASRVPAAANAKRSAVLSLPNSRGGYR